MFTSTTEPSATPSPPLRLPFLLIPPPPPSSSQHVIDVINVANDDDDTVEYSPPQQQQQQRTRQRSRRVHLDSSPRYPATLLVTNRVCDCCLRGKRVTQESPVAHDKYWCNYCLGVFRRLREKSRSMTWPCARCGTPVVASDVYLSPLTEDCMWCQACVALYYHYYYCEDEDDSQNV
jgi:hypothetical protein